MSRDARVSGEPLMRKIKSPCPVCRTILDARLVAAGNEVYQEKECPEHGAFRIRISRDRRFFEKVFRTSNGLGRSSTTDVHSYRQSLENPRTMLVNLTDRCNLQCPICFTDANSGRGEDLSKDELLRRMGQIRGRPSFLLSGGEPTLRKDLSEIIAAIRGRGYVVKLATNGIRLADPDYAAELKRAGLSWVMLQFDGLSDEVYLKTRGRELRAIKLEAIKNLSAQKIPICIGGLQIRGVNDDQIKGMIALMLENEFIRHLAFTPSSAVGRFDSASEFPETDSLDTIQAIEQATEGRVAVDDFMAFRSICSRLYRATGNPFFKQKTCFFQLLIYCDQKDYFSVNRILGVRFLATHLPAAMGLLRSVREILKWEEAGPGRNVKLLTIEKLRSAASVDIEDAGTCNKYQLTRNGFTPICLYNTMMRTQ